MEPIFRPANACDIAQMQALWRLCFPEDDGAFVRRFFMKAPINTGLVACKGEVLSMLFLLPAEVKVGEDRYPVRYLYAGCTHPAHRKGGLFGKLLRYALTYVAAQGECGIYLHPASAELATYYEKHGYRPGIGWWSRKGNCATVDTIAQDAAFYLTKREALLPADRPCWRLLPPVDRLFVDEMLSDGWQIIDHEAYSGLLSPDSSYIYDLLGEGPPSACFGVGSGEWQNTAWWIPAEEGNSLCSAMTDALAYTAFLGDI